MIEKPKQFRSSPNRRHASSPSLRGNAGPLPCGSQPETQDMRRREKLFGDGRPRPLDREAKVRIMHLARCLMRRQEHGRHYGIITAKFYDVCRVLLYEFHNAKSGLCYPSLARIAEATGCARSTVQKAIAALEAAGLMTWVNRLRRVREWSAELGSMVIRVLRTSNGYRFADPIANTEFRSGTPTQVFSFDKGAVEPTAARRIGQALPAVAREGRQPGEAERRRE